MFFFPPCSLWLGLFLLYLFPTDLFSRSYQAEIMTTSSKTAAFQIPSRAADRSRTVTVGSRCSYCQGREHSRHSQQKRGQLCSLGLPAVSSCGNTGIWGRDLSTVRWTLLLLCYLGIFLVNLCIYPCHGCRRFILNNWRLHMGLFFFQRRETLRAAICVLVPSWSVGNQLLQIAFLVYRRNDWWIQTFVAR